MALGGFFAKFCQCEIKEWSEKKNVMHECCKSEKQKEKTGKIRKGRKEDVRRENGKE